MNEHNTYQSPAAWSRMVAAALAEQPAITITGINDLALDLLIHGRSLQADLAAWYRAYSAAPHRHDALVTELVQSLLGPLPAIDNDGDPAALLARVLPMIKPLSLLNEVHERGLPMLVYRPLAGELMVAYVVDEGGSVGYLNERHLRTWQITEAALHERALANLRSKNWTPYPGVLGAGAGALLIFNSGDGYDAARVLLPDVFGQFAARLPGTLVIGLPNRDFLIAFSDANKRVFDQIAAQIEQDARTQQHPLTAQLFTFRDAQLAVYDRQHTSSSGGMGERSVRIL